jgi:hypothetical protein
MSVSIPQGSMMSGPISRPASVPATIVPVVEIETLGFQVPRVEVIRVNDGIDPVVVFAGY